MAETGRGVDVLRRQSIPGRLRMLASDAFVYGAGNMATRLVAVLLVPIIVRAFDVAEYAIVDGIRTFHAVALGVVILGLQQATARWIAQVDDVEAKKDVAGQGLLAALSVSLAGFLVVYALSTTICRLIFGGERPDAVVAVRLVAATLPLGVSIAFAQMLLKWYFRRTAFLILSASTTALSLGLTVVGVLAFRGSVAAVFGAQLTASFICTLLACYQCRDLVARPTNLRLIRELLRFGSPLMVIGTLANVHPFVERVVLSRVLGLEAMGLYGVGQAFARLVRVAGDGFLIAWTPFALALYKESDTDETFNAVLVWYLVAINTVFLVFVFFAEPALRLFASHRYAAAVVVLVPIGFGYLIEGVASITGIGIVLSKRTHLSLASYAVALISSCAFMYLLAERFGIVGIAYSFLLGKMSLVIMQSAIAGVVSGMRYRLLVPSLICVTTFASAIVIAKVWWTGSGS